MKGKEPMTTVVITLPTPHPLFDATTLRRSASRPSQPRLLHLASNENGGCNHSKRRAGVQSAGLSPRWTRKTENPFDEPTSVFRDAIR